MLTSLLLTALLATSATAQDADPREAYDVQTYRLDIDVDPEQKTVSGASAIEFKVLGSPLETFVVDLFSGDDKQAGLHVDGVLLLEGKLQSRGEFKGTELTYSHANNQVRCKLEEALAPGTMATVVVRYSGTPGKQSQFTGFHWEETADGSPWIGTSCQGTGAHWWWPCKANFFSPLDKHERLFVNATVPNGLYAVSNGKLMSRTAAGEKKETFHWENPYGCETYAVSLNIAPYVVVESVIETPGTNERLPFNYYVLPENAEKAAVQFTQVPELLAIYGEAFGPFPFPQAKFALVETSFWGMEHCTAIAYGSSYPLWCEQNGAEDRYASRNKFFDYILIHEVAHEWWGNAVSAQDWGHFWIHEGFATYAEGVYVEKTQGREAADRFFAQLRSNPKSKESLYRGANKTSGEAYGALLYYKGALVLNTLRHYVDNDEAWWKSLREFNLSQRGGNATTKEFQEILERNTGREWERFFSEWFYGTGLPTLKGSVKADGKKLVIDIDNPTSETRAFHIPLRINFTMEKQESSFLIELTPGENQREIELPWEVSEVSLEGLERIAGKHSVEVEG